MSNQPTEGMLSPRSLTLREWKLLPSKLTVEGFIRNGVYTEKKTEIFYLGNWRGLFLFTTPLCPCCLGNLGVVALYQGNLIFQCIGLSCLLKTASQKKRP